MAIYATVASVVGRVRGKPFLVESGRRAVYGVWVLVTVAALATLKSRPRLMRALAQRGVVVIEEEKNIQANKRCRVLGKAGRDTRCRDKTAAPPPRPGRRSGHLPDPMGNHSDDIS